MQVKALVFAALAALVCAAGSLGVASRIASHAEQRSQSRLDEVFAASGDDWATVAADGMRITVQGTAPNAEARDRVMGIARRLIANSRLTDAIELPVAVAAEDKPAEAPDFALQVLRNDALISLIGTEPEGDDRLAAVLSTLSDVTVDDLRQQAPFDAPEKWDASVAFAADIIARLPSSSTVIEPGRVTVNATAPDAETQASIQAELEAMAPPGVIFNLAISAPRKVISPFRFAATLGERGQTACAAESPEDKVLIEAAAAEAGVPTECEIGLGAPSPDWAEVVALGLGALDRLGAGTLEIENANIVLTGAAGTTAEAFEAATSALQGTLPETYALRAVPPPEPETAETAQAVLPMIFTAQADANGVVRLGGFVQNEMLHQATEAFAKAQFGAETVIADMDLNDALPAGWPSRVLPGIEALALLRTGQLQVTPERLALQGTTGREAGEAEVRALLSAAMPAGTALDLDITYDPTIVERDEGVRPTECARQIDRLLEVAQILFPPSETAIDEQSLPIVDEIAEILRACPGAEFEVGGHTDSQGRESSNLALSQARADAVVDALLDRDIGSVKLTARGYGETRPIAPNETEAGRARNRRIAFTLRAEGQEPAELEPGLQEPDSEASALGTEPQEEGLPEVVEGEPAVIPPPRPETEAPAEDDQTDETPEDATAEEDGAATQAGDGEAAGTADEPAEPEQDPQQDDAAEREDEAPGDADDATPRVVEDLPAVTPPERPDDDDQTAEGDGTQAQPPEDAATDQAATEETQQDTATPQDEAEPGFTVVEGPPDILPRQRPRPEPDIAQTVAEQVAAALAEGAAQAETGEPSADQQEDAVTGGTGDEAVDTPDDAPPAEPAEEAAPDPSAEADAPEAVPAEDGAADAPAEDGTADVPTDDDAVDAPAPDQPTDATEDQASGSDTAPQEDPSTSADPVLDEGVEPALPASGTPEPATTEPATTEADADGSSASAAASAGPEQPVSDTDAATESPVIQIVPERPALMPMLRSEVLEDTDSTGEGQ